MFAGQTNSGRFRNRLLALLTGVLALASPLFCQQDVVNRYNVFAGYTYLNSPHVGLVEHGFHLQAGFNPAYWLALGVDYSRATGDLTLTPDMLLTSLQQQLGGTIAGLIRAGTLPPNYVLAVPAHSVTQTFAAGPQLEYRHFKQFTLFLRPSVGAMRERATPHPADPIATMIVNQLAPEGSKLDWVKFAGFGGGVDLAPQKHVSLRIQFDFVRDHLFNDLLKDARNTVRVSIGPAFNFGKNIRE